MTLPWRCGNRLLVTICLALSGCVALLPQTPRLSHEEEIKLFESAIRYELARLHVPQGQTVYVEALDIFSNEPARPADVQAVSRRFSNYKIIVTSKKEFLGSPWMQIHLTSTDGATYLVYVIDPKNADILSLQKRGNSWVVVAVGPIVIT